jgi:hypothetical protein
LTCDYESGSIDSSSRDHRIVFILICLSRDHLCSKLSSVVNVVAIPARFFDCRINYLKGVIFLLRWYVAIPRFIRLPFIILSTSPDVLLSTNCTCTLLFQDSCFGTNRTFKVYHECDPLDNTMIPGFPS